MKRTFNYTGRKRVERKDVTITLRQDGDKWAFDAELRLADYKFPHNANIWIEAHRQNLWMQFPWGSVAAIRPPHDRILSEFDVPDGLLFRLKVVLPLGSEQHKLLGEADGISFIKTGEARDKRRPLIQPDPDDLGDLLWKLDLESEPPRLLVNRHAKPSYQNFARSPYFIALVYPEVMRRLLMKAIVEDEDWSEDECVEGWQADWVNFAKSLGAPTPVPINEQDRVQWIDDAVASFAQRHQLLVCANREVEKESQS